MNLQELILATFLVEALEAALQYRATLKESLFRLYNYYNKSSVLFFSTNIGYIWLIYIALSYNQLNFAIILALLLKSLDIMTKLILIDRLFVKHDTEYIEELTPILNKKAPFWFYLVGVFTYPYIIYIAFLN